MLTAALAFDDLFTLHEGVLPGSFGIPEKAVYAVYVLATLGFLLSFIREVLATRFLLLGLALGFVGTSVLLDQLVPISATQTFVEDSFKFVGILFWAAYFFATALALASPSPTGAEPSTTAPTLSIPGEVHRDG